MQRDDRQTLKGLLNSIYETGFEALDRLKERDKILKIVTNAGKGMQWLKRFNHANQAHEYLYGNKPFCDRFFRLNYLNIDEQQAYIKGKTDLELIRDYRERSGEEHSYGDICVSTDDFTKEYNQKRVKKGKLPRTCSFIEFGTIAGKPFVLKVDKTPCFKGLPGCLGCEDCTLSGGSYCSSVGDGMDESDNIQYQLAGIKEMETKGTIEKLEENVYLIKPENE